LLDQTSDDLLIDWFARDVGRGKRLFRSDVEEIGRNAATIARLKITLDKVKPVGLRRVEVPFDIRLDRLHLTIQAAIG
jgi:hypothetical protein